MSRLLVVTDSSVAATGFGTVARALLPRLHASGFTVEAIGLYEYGHDPRPTEWGTVYPVDPADSLGWHRFREVLARSPDLVLLVHELVYCEGWARIARSRGWLGHVIGYFPVYGPSLSRIELEALRLMDERVCFSSYGAGVVKAHGLGCAAIHLGVDGDLFRPAPPRMREALRRSLGWEGRFVAAYVARNRWNKRQPRLLEAARLLLEGQGTDVLFYLHCVPRPGRPHWVPGMGAVQQEYNLEGLCRELGVEALVSFPHDLAEQTTGIPAHDLVARLQAADCAVHPAYAEGFGLPLVEAMACGLPVVYTGQSPVIEEIVGEAGCVVEPDEELVDAVGNRFKEASPARWADALRTLRAAMNDPQRRRALGLIARRRSRLFSWDRTGESLGGLLHGLVHREASWRKG